MTEGRVTYYDQCRFKEEKDGFILKCERGRSAIRVKNKESEEK